MADLRAEYRITPDQLIDGSISPGDLVALIVWLPDDSAFAASCMGGPEWRGWNPDRLLARGTHLFTHAAVSKKTPKPYPLPEPPRPQAHQMSSLGALPGSVRRREE